MPHLKCVGCKTRYYTPGDGTAPIRERCPGCGATFEPVAELSELVGFRAITSRDASAAGDESGTQEAFLDRLGGLLDLRASETRAAGRGEHWPDGGGATAEAIVLPHPRATC